jgi:hypothetical protein
MLTQAGAEWELKRLLTGNTRTYDRTVYVVRLWKHPNQKEVREIKTTRVVPSTETLEQLVDKFSANYLNSYIGTRVYKGDKLLAESMKQEII